MLDTFSPSPQRVTFFKQTCQNHNIYRQLGVSLFSIDTWQKKGPENVVQRSFIKGHSFPIGL